MPPKNNNLPLMPMKLDPNNKDSRLLFPLCRFCCVKYNLGARKKNYSCRHSPLQRAFYSTCTHLELNASLDAGYRVIELYKVLHYDNWSNEIFKKYVQEFMAVKIHATGFPDWCIDNETKEQYISENWEKFEIKIEKEKMEFNPGKRYIAKLCLNSLWG